MHPNRTLATADVATPDDQFRLRFALAALVTQAARLPKSSPARAALRHAAIPLMDTLNDLTDGRRITSGRALRIADSAVHTGLAAFERQDVIFRPGETLRTYLISLGVSTADTGDGVCELESIRVLNDDEADALESFIASGHASTRPH
jgi:hypothetical protein